MIGYIYVITNKTNEKKYIGQTINIKKRLYEHLRKLRKNEHVNSKLQNAFNKYGEESFDFSYESFEITTQKELDKLEIEYIKLYDSYYNGYNLTLGGDGYQPDKYLFDFDKYCMIRLGCNKFPGFTNIVKDKEECANSYICEIKNGTNYAIYQDSFSKLSEDKKQKYIQRFVEYYNVDVNNLPVDIKREIFTDKEVMGILCFMYIFPDNLKAIADKFNCGKNTVGRILNGSTHTEIYSKFQSIPILDREKIAIQFKNDYEIKWSNKGLKISLFDLYAIYMASENGKTNSEIADHFNLKNTTVKSWTNHSNRKKEYTDYCNLDEEFKKIISLRLWP